MAEHIPGRRGPREGAASLAPKTEVSETHASEVPPSKAHVSKIAGGMGPRLALIQKLRESITQIEQRPVSFSPPPCDTGRTHPACDPLHVRPAPHTDECAHGKGAHQERVGAENHVGGVFGEGAFGDGVSHKVDGDEKASASFLPQSSFPPWSFGMPEIDQVLPWKGLKPSGLHEIKPDSYRDTPVARAFVLALMVRSHASGARAPFLYCITEASAREFGLLYGPGLLPLGLDPAALILVRTAKAQDLFWAMEEGLKSGALSGVLGEIDEMPFTSARRLSLAAESFGTPCLVLSSHDTPGIGPALTRWKILSAESAPHPFDPQAPGIPHWRITLDRCRHGPSGLSWNVEWSYDTHRFRLAASLANRTIETDRQGQPGVARPSRTTSGK